MRRWLVALLALLVLAGGGGAAVYLEGQDAGTPSSGPSPTPVPSRTPLLADLVRGTAPTAAGLQRVLARAIACSLLLVLPSCAIPTLRLAEPGPGLPPTFNAAST